MSQQTYIELFGRRIEGPSATIVFMAIWLTPFFAGLIIGLALRS